MGWLQGNVALVTGGGSGIGYAVVKRFLEEGANVGVLELSEEKSKALQQEFGDSIAVMSGSVTSLADNKRAVAETVSRFGKLDTFIGNAGLFDYFVSLEGMAEDQMDQSFQQIFDVNVKGLLFGAKAALTELVKSKGSIIFTLSSSAFYPAGAGSLYTASKHAVVGLVKQLAYELSPNVRVNGVAPGGTLTDLKGPSALGQGSKSLADVKREVPSLQFAEPWEHTGAYVLLASQENSRLMTGVILHSDGGIGVRGLK